MSQPTLAIVVPAFNAGRFLRATLESVAAQTKAPDELIVVDNGSTDDTRSIAAEFVGRPGVRVECNGENIGAVPNWIKAVGLSRSEYAMVLPADDLLTSDCVERFGAAAKRYPQVKLYTASYRTIAEDGSPLPDWPAPAPRPRGLVAGPDFVSWMVAYGQPNVVAGSIFRRADYDDVGGFDVRLHGALDYDLFLRLAGRGPVWVDPVPNAECRDHAAQWSKDVAARDNNDAEVLFEKVAEYEFFTEAQVRTYVEGLCDYSRQFFTRRLRNPHWTVAELQRERDRIQERIARWRTSVKPYARYVRHWPTRAKPWLAWAAGGTRLGTWAMHRVLAGRPAG